MSILAQDTGAGTNVSDWGSGSDGNAWTHTAGSSSLSRGAGELSALGGTQTNVMLYGPSATDQDAQINLQQNDSNNFMGVVVRASGNTFYYADMGVFSNFLVVGKCISGSFSDLQFFSFTPSAGTKYTMKLQVLGSTINAAAWTAGGSQPAYQISFTDTSISGSGQSGVYFFGAGAVAANFDTFIMTDGSSTSTSTRTIPASVAIEKTHQRSIAASAALLVTKPRSIGANAALSVTGRRSIATSASISVQGTNHRSIPAVAAILSTRARSIPAATSLLQTKNRQISAEASLVHIGQRPIQAQAAIQATSHRSMSAHASISGGITIDRTNATLIVRSGNATLIT